MTFITDVVSSYVHEAEIFAGNMQAMAPTGQREVISGQPASA